MGEMNIDNIKAQMRKGILEYCILSIISRNDAYASSIIAELKAAEMIVVEGTLYPLLTRQKNQGLLMAVSIGGFVQVMIQRMLH